MAQLRQDFQIFVDLDTQILVVGPDNAKQFADYWHQNHLPYPGLPDPKHSILKRYGQEVNLFKLGRMPAQVLVDKSGMARFVHYGNSMSDIPDDEELFEIIQTLNEPEGVR
jgi:peroxiredoxin